MKSEYPSAQEYAAEKARFPALTVVDIRAEESAVIAAYRNQVLFDVNDDCMRLSVFEGEYRWHSHPDSDELSSWWQASSRSISKEAPRQG